MTKTIWSVTDETDKTKTELTYYHFGKEPKFPTWYFENNHTYSVEMLWNLKLVNTPKIFVKCLTHEYIVK